MSHASPPRLHPSRAGPRSPLQAMIASVPHAVAIPVCLRCIRLERAVVAGVPDPIAVAVLLRAIRRRRTRIARIRNAVRDRCRAGCRSEIRTRIDTIRQTVAIAIASVTPQPQAPAAIFPASSGQPSRQSAVPSPSLSKLSSTAGQRSVASGTPSPSLSASGTPQPSAPGSVLSGSSGQPSRQSTTPSPSRSPSETPQPQIPGAIFAHPPDSRRTRRSRRPRLNPAWHSSGTPFTSQSALVPFEISSLSGWPLPLQSMIGRRREIDRQLRPIRRHCILARIKSLRRACDTLIANHSPAEIRRRTVQPGLCIGDHFERRTPGVWTQPDHRDGRPRRRVEIAARRSPGRRVIEAVLPGRVAGSWPRPRRLLPATHPTYPRPSPPLRGAAKPAGRLRSSATCSVAELRW